MAASTRLHYAGLKTSLGASLTNVATSITFSAGLTYGNGASVPTLRSGEKIALSILDGSGDLAEIVWLTAYTSGATTGTIVRGREGTAGVTHASGRDVVHSLTAQDTAQRWVYQGDQYTNDGSVDPTTDPTFESNYGTWDGSAGKLSQTNPDSGWKVAFLGLRTTVLHFEADITLDFDAGSEATVGMALGATDTYGAGLTGYRFYHWNTGGYSIQKYVNNVGVPVKQTVAIASDSWTNGQTRHWVIDIDEHGNGTLYVDAVLALSWNDPYFDKLRWGTFSQNATCSYDNIVGGRVSGDTSDYVVGDLVIHNGMNWVCLVAGTLERPGDGTDWEVRGREAYTEWAPSLYASTTNPTLGTGAVQTSRLYRDGARIKGEMYLKFGTTGVSAGSGTYYIALPKRPKAAVGRDRVIGWGHVTDASAAAGRRTVVLEWLETTMQAVMYPNGAGAVTNAAPFAWAASDIIELHLDYEV